MAYWLKVVFVDNNELYLEDTEKHYISDDLEITFQIQQFFTLQIIFEIG